MYCSIASLSLRRSYAWEEVDGTVVVSEGWKGSSLCLVKEFLEVEIAAGDLGLIGVIRVSGWSSVGAVGGVALGS